MDEPGVRFHYAYNSSSQFNKKCLYTELPGPSRGYNQRSSTRLNCSQNPSAYLLEITFRVLPVESRQGHICRASIYATSVQGFPDALMRSR